MSTRAGSSGRTARRRDVIFHKAVLRDAGGAVAGLAGAMLDVTEQRDAERSLRERARLGAQHRGELPAARRERPGPRRHPRGRAGRVREPGDADGARALAASEVERARRRTGSTPTTSPPVSPFFEGTAPDAAARAPAARPRRQLGDRRVPGHLDRDGGPPGARRHRARPHGAHAGARAARRARSGSPRSARSRPASPTSSTTRSPSSSRTSSSSADGLRRLRGAPTDADGWDEALHALDDALEGAERMRVIVRDLRTMARADEPRRGRGRRPQAPRVRGEPRVERGAVARAARVGRRRRPAGARERGAARPGVREPHRERRARDPGGAPRRARHPALRRRGAGRQGGDLGLRHRRRDRPREPLPDLRPVLHDEAGGARAPGSGSGSATTS